MTIVDFMVSTGALATYNYVDVVYEPSTEEELKCMGCTTDEIRQMLNEAQDGVLEVYGILSQRGWQFDPVVGFHR